MAYICDLLEQHQQDVIEFRKRIQDVIPQLKTDFHREDLCLFKYLVARDYNLDRAEQMLRKHLEYRVEKSVNEVLSVRVPDHIIDGYPLRFCGRDRRGCPVLYHPVGKWQLRKTVKSGWTPDARIFVRQVGEQFFNMCAELSKQGPQVCQYYGIYDMEGFDYTQCMSLEVVRDIRLTLQDYLDNYPEIIRYIRIINAPKIFQITWAVIEPMLTGRIISKVAIYGNNKDCWKAQLLKEVDPDNLPSCCGGSITICPLYRVEAGMNNFPKYKNLPEDELEEATVLAGSKRVVEFELQARDELAWNFRTDDYDIGFQVSCSESETPIVEFCRVDSHKFLQKGLITCTLAGKYSLIFDNSFSKFKPKKLYFVVKKEPMA